MSKHTAPPADNGAYEWQQCPHCDAFLTPENVMGSEECMQYVKYDDTFMHTAQGIIRNREFGHAHDHCPKDKAPVFLCRTCQGVVDQDDLVWLDDAMAPSQIQLKKLKASIEALVSDIEAMRAPDEGEHTFGPWPVMDFVEETIEWPNLAISAADLKQQLAECAPLFE